MNNHRGIENSALKDNSRIFSGEFILITLVITAVLIAASIYNFLLFHAIAELFAVIVAVTTCIVAWQMFPFTRNHYLMYLGSGYFWIGILDFFHILVYKGMNIFPIAVANPATQFWIAARYSEALLLLTAPFLMTRKFSRSRNFVFFGFIAATLAALVLSNNFPNVYIENAGLTKFKIYSEYAIIVLLLISAYHLLQKRRYLEERILNLIILSIIFTIAAELASTVYIGVYGLSDILGHIFKYISYSLIFLAVVRTTLTEPFLEMARGSSTYDAIPNAAIVVYKDCTIRQANKEALRLAGIPESELLGRNCHDVFHRRTIDTKECPVCINIREGKPLASKELHIPENGKYFDFSLSPVSTETEFLGMVHVVRDITKRKILQQQLFHANKMTSLGILVSGVVHEINNPNSLIMLNSQILSKVFDAIRPILVYQEKENSEALIGDMSLKDINEKLPRLLKGITDGSSRIINIVDKLKGFSRNGTKSTMKNVNINRIVKSSIEIAGSLISKSTLNFNAKYSKKLPSIDCNPYELEQVVINLITNSCHSLQNDRKKIDISTGYNHNSKSVVIKVTDEGVGILKRNLNKIMNPFFTTKRDSGGTGLGLSVSYSIVRDHGGTLEFNSKVGKGTTARVMLPVANGKE